MESHDRDQLDQLLDGVLRQYGNVVPRAGLEGRVLANLTASGRRAHGTHGWAWALASVAAVAIAMVIWVRYTVRLRPSQIASAPVPSKRLVSPISKPVHEVFREVKTETHNRRPSVVKLGEAPRLKHFPSPRGISKQELMLANYVEHYPEEAQLVIKQQNEFQQGVEQAQKEIAETLSSDQ